jgi:hypothetical protein
MAASAKRARQGTYLVEHYAPGCNSEELRARAARVRDAVSDLQRQQPQLTLLSSTIVPQDESILCVLEATSEQLIHDAFGRAGIPYERVSIAIEG